MGYFLRKRAIFPVSSSIKRKKALQIPADTHHRPLTLHSTQTAQQELAEALNMFDDAEDGLDVGLALGIARLAGAGVQPMRHRLCGIWIAGRRRVLGEALAQGRVVVLARFGDVRLDASGGALLKVGSAEV